SETGRPAQELMFRTDGSMLLRFPSLETLRLALTTGILPTEVSQTAVTAGLDEDEQLWAQTGASLSRSVQTGLRKLGVQIGKTDKATWTASFRCWAQVLPLVPAPLES